MTIASEITKLNSNLTNCYTAITNKGGTLPAAQDFDNLAGAIGSIPDADTLSIKRVNNNNTYKIPTTNFSFNIPSTITNIGNYALAFAFKNSGITSINISSLNDISGDYALDNVCSGCTSLTSIRLTDIYRINGNYALNEAFSGCSNITDVTFTFLDTVGGNYALQKSFSSCYNISIIYMNSLTTVTGAYAFYYAFESCSNLTGIYLSALTTVTGAYAFACAFINCSNVETVSFNSLTSITGDNSFRSIFNHCGKLVTVNFNALNDLSGTEAMKYAFKDCVKLTNIYFHKLKTTSFGSYKNQFNNMLQGTGSNVTHTLHFPSNLSSTISTLEQYPLFSGNSGKVVLAFDLPATS